MCQVLTCRDGARDLVVVVNFLPAVVGDTVGLLEQEDQGRSLGQVLLDPVGPQRPQVSRPLGTHPLLVVDSLLCLDDVSNLLLDLLIPHL